MSTITFNDAAADLGGVWDEVERNRRHVVIKRQGHEDMALVPAEEIAGIEETRLLLGSPENSVRLLQSLQRMHRGEGDTMTVQELAARYGIHEADL